MAEEYFRKIIKEEDLNPEHFATQAEALAKEMRGGADENYILEKLRSLEELKVLFCRSKEGRGNTEAVRKCVLDLTRKEPLYGINGIHRHAGERRYGVYWVGERVGSHETRKEAEEEIKERIQKEKGQPDDYELVLESYQGKFIRTLKPTSGERYG